MKKLWRKPKLIILERGRPEELVLAGCKLSSTSGPVAREISCYTNRPCNAQACKAIQTS